MGEEAGGRSRPPGSLMIPESAPMAAWRAFFRFIYLPGFTRPSERARYRLPPP